MNLMKFIIQGIAKTKYALKYKLNYILKPNNNKLHKNYEYSTAKCIRDRSIFS